METLRENNDTIAPAIPAKIYSIYAIRGSTMLFGPIAGGFMIYNNFKAFREEQKAQWTWIISLIVLILLCAMGLFFEKQMRGMSISLTIGMGLIAGGLAEHFQYKNIAQHKESGGSTFGFLNIAGICIVALIITLILALTITMRLSPMLHQS